MYAVERSTVVTLGNQAAQEQTERDPRDAELMAALAIDSGRTRRECREAERAIAANRFAPDMDVQPPIPREVRLPQEVEAELLVVDAAQ
jgi:hypothetical protein